MLQKMVKKIFEQKTHANGIRSWFLYFPFLQKLAAPCSAFSYPLWFISIEYSLAKVESEFFFYLENHIQFKYSIGHVVIIKRRILSDSSCSILCFMGPSSEIVL